MMKNKIKPLLAVTVFLILGYVVTSVVMYQNLVNEGSRVADDQCFNVYPMMTARRNSFNTLFQAMQNYSGKEAFEKAMTDYVSASKEYIAVQTTWLDEQKQFMNRLDFQYFNPSYVKELAQYQWDYRNADVEARKLITEGLELGQSDHSRSEELAKKSAQQTQKSMEAEARYNALWNNPPKPDWRDRFISVPTPQCTDNEPNSRDEDFLNAPQSDSPQSDSPLG